MGWLKLAITVIAIAVLCQFEVKETKWAASKSVTLKASVDEAFNFITNVKNCEKWFPVISRVEEADNRPFGVGKNLHAVINIPGYGEHKADCLVSGYKKPKRIVLEPGCVFRPQIEMDFVSVAKYESKVTITIKYRRLSYFFQYTLAPVLYYLENCELERALTSLALQFPQRTSPQKASTQEEPRKATDQKATPKATTQKATPKESRQEEPRKATDQKAAPKETTQKAAAQKATPKVTTQKATPKESTQKEPRKATDQKAAPKATTQKATPKAPTQEGTRKATAQKVAPKATTEKATPKASTKKP